MIRVLAADPYSVVRAGIRSVLASCPELRLAGEAQDFGQLLSLVRSTVCDVVIVDIAAAGKVWFDFVGQLRLARPFAAVLIFTALPEAVYGMTALRAGAGLPHETLSSRELQVFRMLALGRSVGQVADDISLSVKTVSTYRSRILEKTSLSNNAELMRYAVFQDLL